MSNNVPVDKLLEQVMDSISNQQKMESENPDKAHIECPHYFGYLAKHSEDSPFPEECLLCPKVVKCIVSDDSST